METTANNWLLALIPGLPLAAAACGLLAGRRAGARAVWLLCCAGIAAAALCSALLLLQLASGASADSGAPRPAANLAAESWLSLPLPVAAREGQAQPRLNVPLALNAGPDHAFFALSCALLALLVMLFALRERRGDPRAAQFFALLTLFGGSMLLLCVSDTLLLAYLAWELMGVCGYLLIAFSGAPAALRAARQAFWTTRALDAAFLFAVVVGMAMVGVSAFSDLHPALLRMQLLQHGLPLTLLPWFGVTGGLLLLAAAGKSALFPLHFWLADAMEAPSSVSALLHSATLVAAGPYVLYRASGLFFDAAAAPNGLVEWHASEPALLAAILLGALSCLVCAAMALASSDAKRILAYSTVSQLGLAVCAIGAVGGPDALLQIVAHGWAKAILFILAGIAIASVAAHGTSLAALAGRCSSLPARLTLLASALSLGGIALTAGGAAKEGIMGRLLHMQRQLPEAVDSGPAMLQVAVAGGYVAAVMILISLPLTGAYLARFAGILGWGRRAGEAAQGASTWLRFEWLLAALAVAAAFSLPAALRLATGQPLPARVDPYIAVLTTLFTLGGAYAAWRWNVARPAEGARLLEQGGLTGLRDLLAAGLRAREFFNWLLGAQGFRAALRAAAAEAAAWRGWMQRVPLIGGRVADASAWFDRAVVDGARYRFSESWWLLRRAHQRLLQTGYIQHYMLVILLSAVVLCFVVLRPLAEVFKQILGRI